MSNIVLQPNASGTGSITITTPNTNTDRTLNIPDVAGNIVTTGDSGTVTMAMLATSGTLPALDGSALTALDSLNGGTPQKITSSTAAVTFTGIPSTARFIYLSWANVLAASQYYIRLRVGGSTITTGYEAGYVYQYATASNTYATTGGAKHTGHAIQWGNWGAGSGHSGNALIFRNDATTDTDYIYSFSGQNHYHNYNTYGGVARSVGMYDASAAVDGIEFSGDSNLTAGTFNVWYQ
jgi:hypothetical protein